MKILRFLLLPFSLIYGSVMAIRNFCYDKGIFTSIRPKTKTIVVGNLSMGGTGKTPHVEYLVQHLKSEFKIAILSRGYGRKTKGYLLVQRDNTSEEVGDEPLQYRLKFDDKVSVHVCEDRIKGIKEIEQHFQPDIIILDDAYQHRKVNAHINILLTEYHRPIFNDYVVPLGRLREFRSGVDRADIVLVTKTPANIKIDAKYWQDKLHLSDKALFFSKIVYSSAISFKNETVDLSKGKWLVVSGIGNPKPFLEHLNELKVDYDSVEYADHFTYNDKEIQKIENNVIKQNYLGVICTEKDYVKLLDRVSKEVDWCYIPIVVKVKTDKNLIDLIK